MKARDDRQTVAYHESSKSIFGAISGAAIFFIGLQPHAPGAIYALSRACSTAAYKPDEHDAVDGQKVASGTLNRWAAPLAASPGSI